MGMFDIEYNFDNLIRATSAGLEISSFVQVKDAIAKRYKEVFGNDIDIDSTTADGQFIMMMALMLFNGYSGLYFLNQNLDPSGAQGEFLDRLCSFNNIFRKNSSSSSATLYVKYIGNLSEYKSVSLEDPSIQEITCIDKSGKIWQWKEPRGTSGFKTIFTPNPNKVLALEFNCTEEGPIEAEADSTLKNMQEVTYDDLTDDNHGWISKTIDKTLYPFEVWQASDALVGNYEETDTALRKRRLLELGNNGITVVSGLVGSLRGIFGVEEVKVYNNANHAGGADITTNDTVLVHPHDVYFCIRYKEGVDIKDEPIGTIIYQKMTPGIVTTKFVPTENAYLVTGNAKEYKTTVYHGLLDYNVFWKQCLPVSPKMKLKFYALDGVYNAVVSESLIKEAIKKYAFGLSLYDNLNIPDLLSYINTVDVPVNGQKTFFFVEGKIQTNLEDNSTYENLSGTHFENCDTYYKYTNDMFGTFETHERVGNYLVYTINVGDQN